PGRGACDSNASAAQSSFDRNAEALAATAAAAAKDTIERPAKSQQKSATRMWTTSAAGLAIGAMARPRKAAPARKNVRTATLEARPTTTATSAEGPRRNGWGSSRNEVVINGSGVRLGDARSIRG